MFFQNRISPPVIGLILALALISSLISIVMFVSPSFGNKLVFASKLLLMAGLICVIPTITRYLVAKWGQFAESVAQTILATAIVIAFTIWLVGISSLGWWIGVLFLLVFIALVGGYLLRLFQDKLISRLSNSNIFPFSTSEITRLTDSARHQILFYISLPLGFIAAIGYGWYFGLSDTQILVTILPSILGIACLSLALTLIVSSIIMSKSLILLDPGVIKPSITESDRSSFVGPIAKLFRIKLPSKTDSQKDSSLLLSMAYLVADLRKVYFYDAVHSAILLLGFTVAIVSTFNLQFVLNNLLGIVICGLLVLFVFCYLPYSIGQYYLHEAIIESTGLEGLGRKALKVALVEASPLYPQSDFIGALVATGSIGGLLSTLAYEVMKNALK